jgi:hypothetical protein
LLYTLSFINPWESRRKSKVENNGVRRNMRERRKKSKVENNGKKEICGKVEENTVAERKKVENNKE